MDICSTVFGIEEMEEPAVSGGRFEQGAWQLTGYLGQCRTQCLNKALRGVECCGGRLLESGNDAVKLFVIRHMLSDGVVKKLHGG